MLKGKTELILTDTVTGEQEQILEHNMVTNALSDIFRQEGYMKDCSVLYNSIGQPLYTSLLGGILLFDTALEEDASKYYAPPGVRLTASGVYGIKNTVSSLLRGDYNAEESELDLDTKTMKYVYDFATSKGNGTIASVCLTSKWAGFDGYGALTDTPSTSSEQSGALRYALGGSRYMEPRSEVDAMMIDEANDILYSVMITKDPEDTSFANQITLYKKRAGLKNITILRNLYQSRPVIDTTEFYVDKFYNSYSAKNYDRKTNSIYIIASPTSNSEIKPNGIIAIYQIDLSTNKCTKYLVTNVTSSTLYTVGAYIYNGYVYIMSSETKVFKIRITANGDVTEIPCNPYYAYRPTYMDSRAAFERNGLIYYPYYISSASGMINYMIIDTEKSMIVYTNCRAGLTTFSYLKTTVIPIVGNDIMIYCADTRSGGGGNDAGKFFVQTNYLATINNLSKPINKSASQTMKVIYTISEGE